MCHGLVEVHLKQGIERPLLCRDLATEFPRLALQLLLLQLGHLLFQGVEAPVHVVQGLGRAAAPLLGAELLLRSFTLHASIILASTAFAALLTAITLSSTAVLRACLLEIPNLLLKLLLLVGQVIALVPLEPFLLVLLCCLVHVTALDLPAPGIGLSHGILALPLGHCLLPPGITTAATGTLGCEKVGELGGLSTVAAPTGLTVIAGLKGVEVALPGILIEPHLACACQSSEPLHFFSFKKIIGLLVLCFSRHLRVRLQHGLLALLATRIASPHRSLGVHDGASFCGKFLFLHCILSERKIRLWFQCRKPNIYSAFRCLGELGKEAAKVSPQRHILHLQLLPDLFAIKAVDNKGLQAVGRHIRTPQAAGLPCIEE
mmetsp:Transcript_71263/g.230790  ORF Transcript_71263/g.230790 Transcript_71263/m.230790 type:complete len:375 (-) Transcript_71263:258-1382(-)